MGKKKPRPRPGGKKAKVQPASESVPTPRARKVEPTAEVEGPSISSPFLVLVYGCVLISGAAALIYEVVWARELAQFLGITAYAHAAVLTAFMVGLALGSYLIGARADRIAKPLRAYALLELGIGVYALGTLLLFDWAEVVYVAAAQNLGVSGVAAHGFRFCLALVMLFIPTFLMGGTLPLLVRGLSRKGTELAKLTSRLYGLNTLGATLGAFLGGYVFLPGLGMTGTTWVSAGLALLAAFGVLALGSRLEEISPEKSKEGKRVKSADADPENDVQLAQELPTGARWILVGFALSGFAAMVYQLCWIRALTLVIGGSVYAFSTTLTTFLAGIALGSFAASRLAGTYSRDRFLRISGWLQAGIAVTAAAGLWLIGKLPDLFLKGYNAGLSENFTLYLGFIFLLCFGLMFLPTFLLGAVFPLVATTWAKRTSSVGRGIGTAYAANSVGTILGSLTGGLLILPLLGIHGSTFLAAGASLAAGGIFWLRRPLQSAKRNLLNIGGVVAVVAMVGVLVPKWDKTVMTSGVFYHTSWFTEHDNWQEAVRTRNLLYYKEGVDAVVCVTELDGDRILHINGKPDGSNGEDLSTQILLVQIPMLLHPAPRKAVVIGLGTGTTSGGAVAHESLQSLDVVEISEEVVEASQFFKDINRGVLDDPRTTLNVADARNFMLTAGDSYDVIVSEPSNPWISGVANMFTREFFELAKSRLADGGIMSQWIHCYNMAEEDLRGIIRTYQSVFANVTMWIPARGDLILIGSEKPHGLDYARVSATLGKEKIGPMMASIGRETFEKVASTFFLGNEDLKVFAGDAPLNTDDRPRLEFSAPRYLYSMTTEKNLAGIMTFLAGRSVVPPVSGLVGNEAGSIAVPSMGLTIRPGEARIENVKFAFVVNRQVSENGMITAGTQHLLEWTEGGDLISLAASSNSQPWTAADRDDILTSAMSGGVLDKGEVRLPTGEAANWVAGAGADARAGTIGLAWSSRSKEGEFRDFFSLRQLSNSSRAGDDLRKSMRLFARQFETSSPRADSINE
jgi:spermidine synthase